MKEKFKKISGILAGSLTLLFPFFESPRINAQELKPISIEHLLDYDSEQLFPIQADLIVNYGLEDKTESVIFYKGDAYFKGNSLLRNTNIPELNSEETSQIEGLINDIKTKKIKSYDSLINVSKTFSEAQKIVLFASVDQFLYTGFYNHNSQLNEIQSQENFFNNIQNFLSTNSNNQIDLGQCSQIATYIERLANDNRIITSAVTGMIDEEGMAKGHVSNILKLKDGTGIIDGKDILIVKTKNIEKVLECYQKQMNAPVFQHLFFEDNKFKYELIPRDGRNLLDFIEYDPSSKPIKNSLINQNKSNSRLIFNLDKKEGLTSFKINNRGISINVGQIKGDSNSPLGEIFIAQAGFKRKFSFSNMEIFPTVNLIVKDNGISGGITDLIVNSANEEGLNVSSRISGCALLNPNSLLFYHYSIGAGTSYKFKTEIGEAEPYSISQFKYMMKDLGMQGFDFTFEELEAGLKLNIPFSKGSNISFNPYYIKRLWEQEFGADAKINLGNVGLNGKSYLTNSNYVFCPDKQGISAGFFASIGRLELKLDTKLDKTDYEGEKETSYSISFTGKIKLK